VGQFEPILALESSDFDTFGEIKNGAKISTILHTMAHEYEKFEPIL
jgi:hypothetical protein